MSVRVQGRVLVVIVIFFIAGLGGGFWAGYSYFRSQSTSGYQDYLEYQSRIDQLSAEIKELQGQLESLQNAAAGSNYVGWYNEQFIDNVALTQNAFGNLFNEFNDVLGEGPLDEKSVRELESWVEETSVQSAKVTFLDRNHFDLWDWTSNALELFEDFLEDLRATVRFSSEMNRTIILDQDSMSKLEEIYDDLQSFYEHVFPVDVLEEGTMWQTPHHNEANTALGMLSRLREDVAKAWLMLPVLSGSEVPPPDVQAYELLVEAVGEEYFTKFFEFKSVQFNDWEPDDWLTRVDYSYRIQTGNYTATREVYFYFDKVNRLLSSSGVPPAGNLMPFSVSREEAINIALGRVTQSHIEVEAEIRYVKRLVNNVPVNRYVWQVVFYLTKKSAPSGSTIEVLIDLKSGEVIDVARFSWMSTS